MVSLKPSPRSKNTTRTLPTFFIPKLPKRRLASYVACKSQLCQAQQALLGAKIAPMIASFSQEETKGKGNCSCFLRPPGSQSFVLETPLPLRSLWINIVGAGLVPLVFHKDTQKEAPCETLLSGLPAVLFALRLRLSCACLVLLCL